MPDSVRLIRSRPAAGASYLRAKSLIPALTRASQRRGLGILIQPGGAPVDQKQVS